MAPVNETPIIATDLQDTRETQTELALEIQKSEQSWLYLIGTRYADLLDIHPYRELVIPNQQNPEDPVAKEAILFYDQADLPFISVDSKHITIPPLVRIQTKDSDTGIRMVQILFPVIELGEKRVIGGDSPQRIEETQVKSLALLSIDDSPEKAKETLNLIYEFLLSKLEMMDNSQRIVDAVNTNIRGLLRKQTALEEVVKQQQNIIEAIASRLRLSRAPLQVAETPQDQDDHSFIDPSEYWQQFSIEELKEYLKRHGIPEKNIHIARDWRTYQSMANVLKQWTMPKGDIS